MGSLLCCLSGPEDGTQPVCCFCLPWFFAYQGIDSGSAARQRGDTRVAPDHVRIPLAAQADPMDTFRSPPRPLPYSDLQLRPQMVQHPVISGHDKASTQFQKPGQLTESKITDAASTCAAQTVNGPSIKHHPGGPRIDGIQVCSSFENEDDCPICLEEYYFENPKIVLQCNHNFHLSCIYEWMERSQVCPVCAKVMLFNEDDPADACFSPMASERSRLSPI